MNHSSANLSAGQDYMSQVVSTFSRAMTANEMKTAAEYFAALPVKRWTRVIEADTVPKTYFLGHEAHAAAGRRH
jgi:chemotaxis methyl-accepting protein methylase